jgi:hypothetical protein
MHRSGSELARDDRNRGTTPLVETNPLIRVYDHKLGYVCILYASHEGGAFDMMPRLQAVPLNMVTYIAAHYPLSLNNL